MRVFHILPLALLLSAAPLLAQGRGGPGGETEAAPPPVVTAASLSLEQRMMLRCSAAFALVADRQARGEDWALAYPPLAGRGREFFVRASARLIDETQVSTTDLATLLRAEASALLDHTVLDPVMPVCLTLLPPEPQG